MAKYGVVISMTGTFANRSDAELLLASITAKVQTLRGNPLIGRQLDGIVNDHAIAVDVGKVHLVGEA